MRILLAHVLKFPNPCAGFQEKHHGYRKKVEVERRPELLQLEKLGHRIRYLGDEEKRLRARRGGAEEERMTILQQMGRPAPI